jgi:glycosidase
VSFDPAAWFASPDWPAEAVLYQLDPRVFGGRYVVDMATLVHERDGAADLVFSRANSGTFRQVTAALDAIRALGPNTLWVMPPWVRGQKDAKGIGSPYAVRDYGRVATELGDDEDFRTLVAEAHVRSMKVIVGFVPNHVSRDALVLARHRPPHDAWAYHHKSDPARLHHDGDWTDTVKLNYANPNVRKWLTETMIDLIRRYDVDGMRCDMAHLVRWGSGRDDVAGDGYPELWRETLGKVRAAFPGRRLFFLAEVYGHGEEQSLLEQGFDAVYHKEVFDLLRRRLDEDAPGWDFQADLHREVLRLAAPGRGLRFAENHDDARAVRIFGGFREARAVAALGYVLPSPCMVYSGQEYGSFVKPSITELHEPVDPPGLDTLLATVVPAKHVRAETWRFFRRMLALREQHDALRLGEVVPLRTEHASGGGADERVIAIARVIAGAREAIVAAINFDRAQMRWVSAPGASGVLERAGIGGAYSVHDLLAERALGERKRGEALMLGLAPLETQVLHLRAL